MNRRSFLGALAGFAVLPSAQTYKRIWQATESGVLTPDPDFQTYCFRFIPGSKPGLWEVEMFEEGKEPSLAKELPTGVLGVLPNAKYMEWYQYSVGGKKIAKMKMISPTHPKPLLSAEGLKEVCEIGSKTML